MRLFSSILLLPAMASLALAQEGPIFGPGPAKPPETVPEEEKPAPPVQPSIKKLDETRLQVGEVIFDKKTREIRFPVQVNMTEGLLEFLVVHQNGKVHESLFSTAITPTHLNLALTLLRYKASPELFPLPDDTGGPLKFPDVPAATKAAARLQIEAEWKDGEKVRRYPAHELIRHDVKGAAMPVGPWLYTGSDVNAGKFAADLTGDIIAIFTSRASMMNYPGEDSGDDTVWVPFPKRIPPLGTPATIIITPYPENQPLPKP